MEITKFNIWVFVYSESGNIVCKKYLLVCAVCETHTCAALYRYVGFIQNVQLIRMNLKYLLVLEILIWLEISTVWMWNW